jgi:hypothetical protein
MLQYKKKYTIIYIKQLKNRKNWFILERNGTCGRGWTSNSTITFLIIKIFSSFKKENDRQISGYRSVQNCSLKRPDARNLKIKVRASTTLKAYNFFNNWDIWVLQKYKKAYFIKYSSMGFPTQILDHQANTRVLVRALVCTLSSNPSNISIKFLPKLHWYKC